MSKEVRVATCGSSLTYQGDYFNLWQRQVERGLREGKQSVARLYNFGENGAASDTGLFFLNRALITRPEIVVLEYNMNDAYTARNISVGQAQINHQSMITQLRDNDPNVKICLMIMNQPIAGGSIPLSQRPNWAAYAQNYRDMCVADDELTLIDLAPAWVGATTTDIPDGVHPTKAAVTARSVPLMISSLRPLIG
ncbi:SGNH/GDSL hydrolase family protein [Rhizobium leguminosarum]|uniref:SGNH/GDSL hydrolase family protein n=1 Tax=Rhizobium leguminosarum TaxID=384 RepID=UPI001C9859A2|nr:SGNH/GDSL hydrolase family protein [Rhizobium leguminosarum]MBY5733493.1 SGNH/GDSL hydrolase family protein [Rhizobium leguminosarum]